LPTTRAPALFVMVLQVTCATASLDHLEDIGF
jgi:hypothetical protein